MYKKIYSHAKQNYSAGVKKIILLLGIIFVFFLKADFISAALNLEVTYPKILGYSINNASKLADYICYFFGLGFSLAFFIAVIVIAYGGIYYLVSYGRGKFTDEGKDWIKAGISGLLIIVCAALIIKTINPDLSTCKFVFLPDIIDLNPFDNDTTPSDANLITFKEFPIGILTEKLLTRTIPCYSFDRYGDPIYHPVSVASTGPGGKGTELEAEKDRVECFMQLVEGAQKKAQVIAELSDEIAALMNNECDCNKYDSCQASDNSCVLDPSGANPGTNDQCDSGICKPNGAPSCSPTFEGNPYDDPGCCNPDSGIPNPSTGKNYPVKYIIEHGPIELSFDVDTFSTANCPNPDNKGCCAEIKTIDPANPAKNITKTFRGLDEFRCDTDKGDVCSDIHSIVETEIAPPPGSTVPATTQVQQKLWDAATLWQQLTWFKEAIESLRDTLPKDIGVLDNAKNELGKCYLAMPYVDVLKTYKITDQEQHIVLKDPQTFTDPELGNVIDPSKYCTGFNYANSSCYKKCNNICPDSSDEAIKTYESCTDEACIENAYNSRPCPNATGDNAPATFGECIGGCQNDCQDSCDNCTDFSDPVCKKCYEGQVDAEGKVFGGCNDACTQKYLPCSVEFSFCEKYQYKSNSACIFDTAAVDPNTGETIDNSAECLFNSQSFANCAKNYTDQGNAEYCINNAYLCKNGSDQYAGYLDCQDPKTATVNCSDYKDPESCATAGSLKIECAWDGQNCFRNYSASFFYNNEKNNPPAEKCPEPFKTAASGSYCYGSGVCWEVCPETSKCPSFSDCPDCPCDRLNETVKFPIPGDYDITKTGHQEVNTIIREQEISGSQMVGSECMEYAYNDDPLTFYCEDSWWNNPDREGNIDVPIGTDKTCSVSQEVPIGQTIDDAKGWAQTLVNTLTKIINDDIQPVIDQMTKVGKTIETDPVQNYCKCNAQLEDASPLCIPDCTGTGIFVQDPTTYSCPAEYSTPDNPVQETSVCTHSDYYPATANYICSGSCTSCTYTYKTGTDADGYPICNGVGTCNGSCTSYETTGSTCTPCTPKTCRSTPCGSSCTTVCTSSLTFDHYSCSNPSDVVVGDQCRHDTTTSPTPTIHCHCEPAECKGKPCKQMVIYLGELWNKYKQFKEDFVDFTAYMFTDATRSDALKKLTYSRQMTNFCNTIGSTYGVNARLLSCSRVEDELIDPINSSTMTKKELSDLVHNYQIDLTGTKTADVLDGYCYGKELGKAIASPPLDLTDNWFCCEQYKRIPTPNNNPIYNIEE